MIPNRKVYKCHNCGNVFKATSGPFPNTIDITPTSSDIFVPTTFPSDAAVICEKCLAVNDKKSISYWRQELHLLLWGLVVIFVIFIISLMLSLI